MRLGVSCESNKESLQRCFHIRMTSVRRTRGMYYFEAFKMT